MASTLSPFLLPRETPCYFFSMSGVWRQAPAEACCYFKLIVPSTVIRDKCTSESSGRAATLRVFPRN